MPKNGKGGKGNGRRTHRGRRNEDLDYRGQTKQKLIVPNVPNTCQFVRQMGTVL